MEYSVNKVAAMCDCEPRTARKWAAANGVRFTGEGNRKNYHFTDTDVDRFRQRPRPGRRWPEKEE
jgi:hypothetical protein